MHTKTMVNRLPLTKARVNLGALIKRVHNNKEHFILEKDGIPVAALLDVDEYEDYLDSQDPSSKSRSDKDTKSTARASSWETSTRFLLS